MLSPTPAFKSTVPTKASVSVNMVLFHARILVARPTRCRSLPPNILVYCSLPLFLSPPSLLTHPKESIPPSQALPTCSVASTEIPLSTLNKRLVCNCYQVHTYLVHEYAHASTRTRPCGAAGPYYNGVCHRPSQGRSPSHVDSSVVLYFFRPLPPHTADVT